MLGCPAGDRGLGVVPRRGGSGQDRWVSLSKLPGLERRAPAAKLPVRAAGHHDHDPVFLLHRRRRRGAGKAPAVKIHRAGCGVSLRCRRYAGEESVPVSAVRPVGPVQSVNCALAE